MKLYNTMFFFSFFLFSCKVKKSIPINCEAPINCAEVFHCNKEKLKELYSHFSGVPSYNDPFDKLLACTAQLAHEGNKEAQRILLAFYVNQKKNYKNELSSLSDIAEGTSDQIVISFSKLRGKEAFELALEYAKNTTCIEPNDYIDEGNCGLNVIVYIINPMIKSVSEGYRTEGEYSNYDFDENGESKPFDVNYCKRQHKEAYDKLVKAYKEGKIILKEYGE